MAITRSNKFDAIVEELNDEEAVEHEKTERVLKRGTNRRKSETRKVLPTYIPQSLYEEFDAITRAYGISNNAAICQLIRDYVTAKRSILNEL